MSYADVAASGHRQSAEEVCICLLASCYITASPLFVLTQIVHDVQAISSRLTFLFPPPTSGRRPSAAPGAVLSLTSPSFILMHPSSLAHSADLATAVQNVRLIRMSERERPSPSKRAIADLSNASGIIHHHLIRARSVPSSSSPLKTILTAI